MAEAKTFAAIDKGANGRAVDTDSDSLPSYTNALQESKERLEHSSRLQDLQPNRRMHDLEQSHPELVLCRSYHTFHPRSGGLSQQLKRLVRLSAHNENIGGPNCPSNHAYLDLGVAGRHSWWLFHLVTRYYQLSPRHGVPLETLKVVHKELGGRSEIFVDPRFMSGRLLLRVICWNRLEHRYLVGGLERLPRCRHLAAYQDWLEIYQSTLKFTPGPCHKDEDPLDLRLRTKEVRESKNGFKSDMFHCDYCPVEFRFSLKIIDNALNYEAFSRRNAMD